MNDIKELKDDILEKITGGDSLPISSPDGWIEGTAKAYGGSTDPSSSSVTATGELLDDYSMGVSIPMSWPNYYTYFGRSIEIKYGGTIVVARINDCGNLADGISLGLQPGVFKAFLFETCSDWGTRQISYRIR